MFPIVLWEEPETPSTDLIYYLHSTTDIPINKLTAIPNNFLLSQTRETYSYAFWHSDTAVAFYPVNSILEKGFTMPKYGVDEGGKSSRHTCSFLQTQKNRRREMHKTGQETDGRMSKHTLETDVIHSRQGVVYFVVLTLRAITFICSTIYAD